MEALRALGPTIERGGAALLALIDPGDVEAALIADELRSHAQRQTATRQGRTSVSVNSPHTFRATGAVIAGALMWLVVRALQATGVLSALASGAARRR